MENIALNEMLDIEILESRLEMESMAALPTTIANSIVCHCSIIVPPSAN